MNYEWLAIENGIRSRPTSSRPCCEFGSRDAAVASFDLGDSRTRLESESFCDLSL